MTLPLPWTASSPQGSQWTYTFTTTNGLPASITGKTFELVLRPDPRSTGTPSAVINSSAPTGQGSITINTSAVTVTAVLSPTATSALQADTTYAATLWMDPGLTDATALVVGLFTIRAAAAP